LVHGGVFKRSTLPCPFASNDCCDWMG